MSALADEIFECRRGEDAVAAAAAHRPELLLMDIAMRASTASPPTVVIRERFPSVRVAKTSDTKG
jgi:hypothetical protein